MKKCVLFLMTAALMLGSNVMAQGQQIPNGDFETWTFDGEHLPNNWNSFQTLKAPSGFMGGIIKGIAYVEDNRQVKRSTDVRPGSSGQYSCSIWSRNVAGDINAQGNLTSGRVNAGGMSATDVNNYNFTDRANSTKNGDVTNPFAMKFTGTPKAVRVWVKYVQAGQTADYGDHATAKFSAIIHGDADYISYGLASNDNDANKALVVASAVKEINYNGGKWEELIIPFEYTNNGAQPAYIQVNASTNAYPGAGMANDYLYIDDIEMIYNEGDMKVFANDPLYVTVNDVKAGPLDAIVLVKENGDNTINFSLKNFVLKMDEETELGVGNIDVNNIPVTVAKGVTSFTANQSIEIAEGDDPTVDGWMGPSLGAIPLDMSGKYDRDHLYVTINIPLNDYMQVYVELGSEDAVTGIGAVKVAAPKAKTAGNVIYDINGRRVSEMQPGRIYIVDGKKVVK